MLRVVVGQGGHDASLALAASKGELVSTQLSGGLCSGMLLAG